MKKMLVAGRALLLAVLVVSTCDGLGDYEVSDIVCSFGRVSPDKAGKRRNGEKLSAVLRKPQGFRGSPIFADDRQVDATRYPAQLNNL